MGAAFQKNDGVPCRVCGAVFAQPGNNPWGVCATCHAHFKWHNGQGVLETEPAFIAFIARRLELDIKRFRRNGLVGRCEALSRQGSGESGYQCGLNAITWHDGRKLCHAHAKASTKTVYVGQPAQNHYDVFAELLGYVAARDSDFRSAVARSLELSA